MSKLYVDILTEDQRFGRMLFLEVERLGADVCVGEYRSLTTSEDCRRFVIADLDNYSDAELDRIDASCTLIGFSSKDEYEMPSTARACNVFLHRPFLVSDLLGIISESDSSGFWRIDGSAQTSARQRSKNNVLRVNPERRCAVWGNREISLSDNEYKVLEFLCARRGTLVTRRELDAILGVDCGNMSDVYICHLRAKLDNKLGLKLICTVRGKGYILNN